MSLPHRLSIVVGALAATLVVGYAPAEAAPKPKPGTPSNLVLTIGHPNETTFSVAGTWTAAANTTRYAVRLTGPGNVVLDSNNVTSAAWTALTAAPDGTAVTMTVTAYNANRQGGSVSSTVVLPDLSAPTAIYSVSHVPVKVGPEVTITSSQLMDNTTPTASIVQSVTWGYDNQVSTWNPLAPSITFTYPDVEERYEASVTLTDLAGNTRVYALVIVVNDITPPVGAYALGTPTVWAGWTKVSLAEAMASDNKTPSDKISRVVSWGDGAQSTWTGSSIPTHVYAAAGTYQPTVVLTDETGNSAPAAPPAPVVVKADTGKPSVASTPPAKKKSVKAWRVLKGTATDAETGARNVVLTAVQKRATGWFAYQASSKKWVKAPTKGKAWKKAVAADVVVAGNTWAVALTKLTKGKLLFRMQAFDNVSNASGVVARKASLTRR